MASDSEIIFQVTVKLWNRWTIIQLKHRLYQSVFDRFRNDYCTKYKTVYYGDVIGRASRCVELRPLCLSYDRGFESQIPLIVRTILVGVGFKEMQHFVSPPPPPPPPSSRYHWNIVQRRGNPTHSVISVPWVLFYAALWRSPAISQQWTVSTFTRCIHVGIRPGVTTDHLNPVYSSVPCCMNMFGMTTVVYLSICRWVWPSLRCCCCQDNSQGQSDCSLFLACWSRNDEGGPQAKYDRYSYEIWNSRGLQCFYE